MAAQACFAVEHPAGLVKCSHVVWGFKMLLSVGNAAGWGWKRSLSAGLSPLGCVCWLLLFAAGQRHSPGQFWGTAVSRETPNCCSHT